MYVLARPSWSQLNTRHETQSRYGSPAKAKSKALRRTPTPSKRHKLPTAALEPSPHKASGKCFPSCRSAGKAVAVAFYKHNRFWVGKVHAGEPKRRGPQQPRVLHAGYELPRQTNRWQRQKPADKTQKTNSIKAW